MLKVSDSQMQSAGQLQARRFYEGLGRELRGFMARELPGIPDKDAFPIINNAFQLCQDHGFHTETQIAELSHILVTFPMNFSELPHYRWLDTLLRASQPAQIRLHRIKSCIRA